MSERRRIERLAARFAGGPLVVPLGDDAAVVRPGGRLSVTSVDAVVDGVHFVLGKWPERAVGYKAVAAALSDLAAMGATAGEIYVGAGLPRDFSERSFDELSAGIEEAAREHDAVVAGGDLVASGQLWLSITVVGYADAAEALVTRSGAQIGELVVVTGTLGGSERARQLIEAGGAAEARELVKQLRPSPRLKAGAALAACGAGAMIDISDGLGRDAGHIAEASGVALEIELSRLPLAKGVHNAAFAAGSGEEYELLATVPPSALDRAHRAVNACGTALTAIGTVVDGAGVRLRDAGGIPVEARGFDHFD